MEVLEPLPASWRGMALDLQSLRLAGNPAATNSGSRAAYLRALSRLETTDKPSPDDDATRGGLLLRVGRPEQALAFLRGANARHPDHPALMAHLATAMTVLGDHAGAERVLLAARPLVPEPWRRVESAHLALARARLANSPLAISDPATLQELMLSFPADGRLMAEAAKVALATGDKASATRLLETAMGELGARDAATLRLRLEIAAGRHGEHSAPPRARSYRPLFPPPAGREPKGSNSPGPSRDSTARGSGCRATASSLATNRARRPSCWWNSRLDAGGASGPTCPARCSSTLPMARF